MSTWLGWLRRDRRQRFELVADGESLDECHDKLLAAAKRRRVTDSLCRLMTRGSSAAPLAGNETREARP